MTKPPSDVAFAIRALLDELRTLGETSRIREPHGPDYWPYTMPARGLMSRLRHRGAESPDMAKAVIGLLFDARAALADHSIDKARVDERSRTLAKVADMMNARMGATDGKWAALASEFAAGRIPGEDQ